MTISQNQLSTELLYNGNHHSRAFSSCCPDCVDLEACTVAVVYGPCFCGYDVARYVHFVCMAAIVAFFVGSCRFVGAVPKASRQ